MLQSVEATDAKVLTIIANFFGCTRLERARSRAEMEKGLEKPLPLRGVMRARNERRTIRQAWVRHG